MKRIVVFCIAALALLGCAGKEEAAPAVPAPSLEAPAPAASALESTPAEALPEGTLGEALIAAWDARNLLEGLYEMAPEDALDYYGIDLSRCRYGAIYMDAEGYTNEAVVLEGDKAVLDEAEGLLREHLDAVKAQFRGYDPAALALAEKAVFLREGDVLLFIVSPHAEEMWAVYDALSSAR